MILIPKVEVNRKIREIEKMADDKEKLQGAKLEAALFLSWHKRERFIIFCKNLNFGIDNLLLISGQYYRFESN